MVDMSAASTRAGHQLTRAQHQGFAERLAIWILARSERRRAAELERLAWDLEAQHDRREATCTQRDHHVVLPPGGGLF